MDNGISRRPKDTPCERARNERLSLFLHKALPSREDTEKICNATRHPAVLSYEIMTLPYATLDQRGLKTSESLLNIPEPNLHPVLISRYMLLLASFLQHLQPELQKGIKGLLESPRATMERLADLAIGLVTTNDQLLGSIEGLECVMIESVYQANIGNLRRSWLACRRAMSIAQLMGINRSHHPAQYKVLDPESRHHPQLMWFRIVFLDRYLCLLLGLSQGSLDRSMASDAMLMNDTQMGRLERTHCAIASRILERNEAEPSSQDLALTRTLDVELQRAARSLPSKWWLAPNLDVTLTDSQSLFWSTRRLFTQVFHYNLLNQLHLPYILRSSSAKRNYEYSLIACVNASREVLSRFIALRSFDGSAYSCRTVDFLAHMAAMTLLLAHLDSRFSETENLLAHQYHSDRAMIEQVQENMKEVNRLNSDALSAKSADLLSRLLNIEIETAIDDPRCAKKVSVQNAGTGTAPLDPDADIVVSVHIPYFGVVQIAREGIRKEVPKQQAPSVTTISQTQSQVSDRSTTSTKDTTSAEPQTWSSEPAESGIIPGAETITTHEAGYGHVDAPPVIPSPYVTTQGQRSEVPILANSRNNISTHFSPPLPNFSSAPLLEQGYYPGLAAGEENWAFQGADLAFFESLMRGTEHEGNGWTTFAGASMSN